MQFVLFLAIMISLSVVSNSSPLHRMKDSLSKQDCRNMIGTPEFDDNYSTWTEQMCLFWVYGFEQKEAERYATATIEDGDLDKNGAIDGEELFGRPNPEKRENITA